MNRGVLAALRRILAALLAVVLAMTVVFPSSSEALRGCVGNLAPWVLLTAAVYGVLGVPALVRRLAALRRGVPLTGLEIAAGVGVTLQVVFFAGVAVLAEEGDQTLSTFDDALRAFLDGSTGLQPLKAVAIARDSSPPRSWTPSRMVAAAVSLFNGLSDPKRALKRLTGQLRMWRELNQAIDLDTKGGSEPVNDEAARAFLRSFLAAQAAEGEGGGATGAEPHGGDDSRAPA